jgi:hypothetical protein
MILKWIQRSNGYVLVGLLIGILIFIVFKISPNPKEEHSNQIVVKKKQYPPHQWFWQEVVDQNGVKHGARTHCL